MSNRLEFAKFDEADAGDGFYLAQGFNGGGCGGGRGDVDLDDGDGLALGDALRAGSCSGCAAESEVGDVDGVLAEDGADAADDAGDVVVADGDEGAVEGGFGVDAVVAEEAWRCSMKDGGLSAGVAVGGVQDELEDRADSAGGELLFVFLYADSALGCDGSGVDAVGGGAFAIG